MKSPGWLIAAVAVTILVAVQVTTAAAREDRFVAGAGDDVPVVAAGVDVLAGIPTIPMRVREHDYRRAAFGDAWTDDTTAPGGHNGCDTRNDILDRDLVDKTFTAISRCPTAVATGTLYDPYTDDTLAFTRGNQVGASVQIDHILSAAVRSGSRICAGQHIEGMPLTIMELRA